MTRLGLLAAAAVMLTGAAAHADILKFHAALSGASQVPPVSTPASGAADATLNTDTKKLDYSASWQALSGPATAAHFHGPAAPGANAGVVVPWPSPVMSPLNATATLTDAQIADLKAGKWYANVHTAEHPGGEIRGQMMPVQ